MLDRKTAKAMILLRGGRHDDEVARRTGLSFTDILGLRGELAAAPARRPAPQPSR